MLALARRAAWSIPIGITFTDLVGTVIRVEGASMQPTFNPPESTSNDWVLVEKVSVKWLHRYERGAIMVLWAPDDPHQSIIKRVVGLEGDVVWDEDAKQSTSIPQGRCWIEGDNTSKSGDSRSMYGPVHLGLLEGRAAAIIWPPWRIGVIVAHVPAGKLLQMGGVEALP